MKHRRIATVVLSAMMCVTLAGMTGCAPSAEKDDQTPKSEATAPQEQEETRAAAEELAQKTIEADIQEAVEASEADESDTQDPAAEAPEEDSWVDPAYHVSTGTFEFDIPEYWRDRVEWIVDESGTEVTIYPIVSMDVSDDYYLAKITQHSADDMTSAGDYITHLAGSVEGADGRLEVRTKNWPAYYADFWAGNPNYSGSSQELEMVDALLDLSTGGAITRSEVMDAAVNSSGPGDASKDLGMMDVDFANEYLIPSVAYVEQAADSSPGEGFWTGNSRGSLEECAEEVAFELFTSGYYEDGEFYPWTNEMGQWVAPGSQAEQDYINGWPGMENWEAQSVDILSADGNTCECEVTFESYYGGQDMKVHIAHVTLEFNDDMYVENISGEIY